MTMKKNNEQGFTYIEVMCAIVILLVGILAQVSAITFSVLRQREAEQQSIARQIAASTIESIFAARDLANDDGISSFANINTTDVSTDGIFIPGWFPVREDAGKDGILGTADDSCTTAVCTVGSYTNASPVKEGFERRIVITDIVETGSSTVKKRRIEVRVRFFVGQLQREQTLATIIADLPFYK
jgi:prepilin-type N-terminal cleavage/methylation domain-containing protein